MRNEPLGPSSVGGSGKKKDLANVTLFLHRDDEDESLSYCDILKNREFGTKGRVRLNFDPAIKQYICAEKGNHIVYPWVRQYEAYLQEKKERN